MTHPHHAKLHVDIADRLAAYQWLPAGRRWHAARQAAWAIGDHLRCCHGARRLGLNPRIAGLVDIHAGLHQAAR